MVARGLPIKLWWKDYFEHKEWDADTIPNPLWGFLANRDILDAQKKKKKKSKRDAINSNAHVRARWHISRKARSHTLMHV